MLIIFAEIQCPCKDLFLVNFEAPVYDVVILLLSMSIMKHYVYLCTWLKKTSDFVDIKLGTLLIFITAQYYLDAHCTLGHFNFWLSLSLSDSL